MLAKINLALVEAGKLPLGAASEVGAFSTACDVLEEAIVGGKTLYLWCGSAVQFYDKTTTAKVTQMFKNLIEKHGGTDKLCMIDGGNAGKGCHHAVGLLCEEHGIQLVSMVPEGISDMEVDGHLYGPAHSIHEVNAQGGGGTRQIILATLSGWKGAKLITTEGGPGTRNECTAFVKASPMGGRGWVGAVNSNYLATLLDDSLKTHCEIIMCDTYKP